jgi:hypothetical protein
MEIKYLGNNNVIAASEWVRSCDNIILCLHVLVGEGLCVLCTSWLSQIHHERGLQPFTQSGVSFQCVCLFWRNTFTCHFWEPASLLSRRTLVTGFDLVPVTAWCCFDACAYLLWRNSFSCQFYAAAVLLSRRMLVRSFWLMLVTAGCCFGMWVRLR